MSNRNYHNMSDEYDPQLNYHQNNPYEVKQSGY